METFFWFLVLIVVGRKTMEPWFADGVLALQSGS